MGLNPGIVSNSNNSLGPLQSSGKTDLHTCHCPPGSLNADYGTDTFTLLPLPFSGCEPDPSLREQAQRIICAFWMMFHILIIYTYSGNLTASIAVPKYTLPIETLQDLADSTFKYGTIHSSAIYGLMQVLSILIL